MGLPMVSMSGCRPQAAVAPPGPAQMVCVSSMTSRVPVSRVMRRNSLVVARVGQDDADVGQGRFGQHAGHVAGREGGLERLEVVELHDLGRESRVDLGADVGCRRRVLPSGPS